jgi:type II secretory pathway pseudopilin PulG
MQNTQNDHGLPAVARSRKDEGPRITHRREGGYALLAILVGAVIVSVYLVQALPREAMSAQRIREERLIDRGQEYSRAIKLYFRENKKYPKELDDLEDTNGVRYLRRRYKDPITGEDEWRLVHIGTDGRFKDSLIYDTEDPEELQNAEGGNGIGGSGFGGNSRGNANRNRENARMDAVTYQSLYGTQPPAQPGAFAGANRARQTRDSAAPVNPLEQQNMQLGLEATGQGDPNNPENAGLGPDGRPLPADQQQPTDLSNLPPGQVPPEAGQRAANQQLPNQPGGGPGYSLPSSRGSISSRNQRGGFNQAGLGAPGQAPAAPPAGSPFGGGAPVGVSGDAASMIGRLLTTPRPGGLAGIQGQNAMQGGQGQAFEEGIAGVASKAEEFGVKVYKGKNTYNEWEFVYDYRQDAAMGGVPGGAQAGAGNIDPSQPGLTPGGGFNAPATAFQPVPGMPPAGQPPPTGPDPRQTQFGGASATPRLPSTGAYDPNAPQRQPETPDGAPPEVPPVGPSPDVATPPVPPAEQPPQRTPGRSYRLPRSRTSPQPNQ